MSNGCVCVCAQKNVHIFCVPPSGTQLRPNNDTCWKFHPSMFEMFLGTRNSDRVTQSTVVCSRPTHFVFMHFVLSVSVSGYAASLLDGHSDTEFPFR